MELSSAQLDQWKKEYWVQRRQLMLAIILMVVAIFLLLLGGQRLLGLINQTNARLRKERDTLAKIQRRVRLVEEITSDDRTAFNQASLALPASKQPLAILRSLEDIARETGMSLGHYDLNPGLIATEEALLADQRKKDESVESFVIRLEMSGSFNSLLSALQEMERVLPLMEITQLAISPVSQQLNEDISQVPYKAELQVRSFYALFDAAKIVEAARSSGVIQFTEKNEQTAELIAPLRYRLRDETILQGTFPNFGNTDVFGTQVPLEARVQGPSLVPDATGSAQPEAVTEDAGQETAASTEQQ